MSNIITLSPQKGAQTRFFLSKADITFFGSMAGVGKSFMLNLKNLTGVGQKNYTSVTFRRNSTAFDAAGSIFNEAVQMFLPLKPKINRTNHSFAFNNNVLLNYSHLQLESSVYLQQGNQYAQILFDELSHFSEFQFLYMMSRNRPLLNCPFKPSMSATMNPDSESWIRQWVDWYIDDDGFAVPSKSGLIRWFVRHNDEMFWFDNYNDADDFIFKNKLITSPKSFTFIPAWRTDNKLFFDTEAGESYIASLSNLTMVERERLLSGNWNIKESKGNLFKKDWLPVQPIGDLQFDAVYRAWDLAATAPAKGKDPDFTATCKIGRIDNQFYILDYNHFRNTPAHVEEYIRQTAQNDGRGVMQIFEQEAGSSGVFQKNQLSNLLKGHPIKFEKSFKNKVERARAFSVASEQGNVIVNASNIQDEYIREFLEFPEGRHDDLVDATTLCFNNLQKIQKSTYFG